MGSYFIAGCNFPSLASPETKQRAKGTEKLSGDDIFWETDDSSFPTDTPSPGTAKAMPNSRASFSCNGFGSPLPAELRGALSRGSSRQGVRAAWLKWAYDVFQPAIGAAKAALVRSVPSETQPGGTAPWYTHVETTKEQHRQTWAGTDSHDKQDHPLYLKLHFLPTY